MATRLKSLEMHGYKTFATRSLLEFPVQITAVVGPNGAGKSNVADSIRWVLGEQSYSLLRGRKTEDMIFAGSETRARASMASASIVFNNEDGWLPIDYSEVAVTRRAYRDGQNEYLLNGQKVRLKEISELLAKSGLAERTYTIIGQGLVDTALSLKPDERRRFFEEAAGIGLYRGRREEALHRLDNTKRNLERVQDIISELEPRLQTLEKQARKVQEYDRIKADLQILLRDWYGFHWHQGQKDLLSSKENLKIHEIQLKQVRSHLEENEKEVSHLRASILDTRNRLNALHTKSADLHSLREKKNRDLAIIEERTRSNRDQLQTQELENNRISEEAEFLKRKYTSLLDESNQLKIDYDYAQEQHSQANALYQTRIQERSKVENSLKECRQSLVAAETTLLKINAKHQELTSRVEILGSSLKKAKVSLEQEHSSAKTLESKENQAELLVQKAQKVLLEAGEKIKEVRIERENLFQTVKKSEAEIAKLESDQVKNAAHLKVLQDAEKSFAGLNQGAKFILEHFRKSAEYKKYYPLHSLLKVPQQFEKAIASAFGEYLDGIVMDQGNDLESLMVLLDREDKGRAILILPNENKPIFQVKNREGDGVLGLASDLIKAPDSIRKLIDRLLGNTLIVKDRKIAQRLMPELPITACVVTLDGEVFFGSGVVIAGKDKRSGILARPREINDITEMLAFVENQLKNAHKTKDALDESLVSISNNERKLIQENNGLNDQLRDLQKDSQKFKLERDQSRQRISWFENQIHDIEDQIFETQSLLKNQEVQINEEDQKTKKFHEDIKSINRMLNDLDLDDFQTQMAHWKTNSAVTKQALIGSEQRLSECNHSITENEKNQTLIHERIQNYQNVLNQLDSQKTELRYEEDELNQQINTLEELIKPLETELSDFELKFEKISEHLAEHQKNVLMAERRVSQAQLEFSRQKDLLGSLRNKIEDDFGLVSYEYSEEISGQDPLPLGSMVEALPALPKIPDDLDENITRQRSLLRRLGAINPDALNEFQAVEERYLFLKTQIDDLERADSDLRKIINDLDELMRQSFKTTFDAVAVEFRQMFTRLFGGGSARLTLTDEENPTETGIDIEARLPGRREQGLSLLSGGERSLTAVALIFSLLKVSPTPFCVLDEVDAMLDEANVGRFCELLNELSDNTQFIVITHNRNTVQNADVIYGVTMGRDSVSQLISLKLDELSEDMVR